MFPEQITIHPITTLQGEINPPGDRSIAIRALLLSAISQQKVSLIHVPKIPAIRWLCEALSSLGVPIRKTGKSLEIEGIGLTGFKKVFSPLDMGDSATALRLLSGVLAGQNFETELTGYLSLQTRPQKRLIEP